MASALTAARRPRGVLALAALLMLGVCAVRLPAFVPAPVNPAAAAASAALGTLGALYPSAAAWAVTEGFDDYNMGFKAPAPAPPVDAAPAAPDGSVPFVFAGILAIVIVTVPATIGFLASNNPGRTTEKKKQSSFPWEQ
mmetsp:Transcript_12480/g.37032  ORF Transcript_12480/g.37032 Transcript_12480/m.37032 type:complete len:139 (-) Transcript_12480:48-464(-)